jgi:glycosyltransferase involved in cell wall biosynthesis
VWRVWKFFLQKGVLDRLNPAEFDVVIVMFDLWWPNNVRAIFCRGRPPLILWGHRHSLSRVANWVRYLVMTHADAHLLYGDEDVRHILDHGIPPEKIFVAPNTQFVSNSQDTSAERKHRVLFVGRLQKSKKVDLLIEAFAAALPRLPPEIVLSIVGNGFDEMNLKEMVRKKGIASRVEFHGELRSDADLLPLFRESIAYFTPGFVGLGAIHGFAYGVPTVTTFGPPPGRHGQEFLTLKHGVNSLVLDSEPLLVDAIVELSNDREQCQRLGAAAFTTYQNTRRLDQMLAGFRACIEYVTRDSRPGISANDAVGLEH